MKTTTTLIKMGLIAAAAMSLALYGCGGNDLTGTQQFPTDPSASGVNKVIDAQTARGARNDGMLYPHHFDGGQLNSLGSEKLDLMMRDEQGEATLMVYVNLMKNDTLTSARTKSVQDYLGAHGMLASAYKVEVGTNPNAWSLANPSLQRMSKTESASMGGGDSAVSGSGSGDGAMTTSAGK